MKRISYCLVLGLLWCSAPQGPAADPSPLPNPPATSAPAPAPPQNRFLFILDVSSSMEQFDHDGRQPLFDMIYTGLEGYLQKGDTFGLWTFSDKLNAGVYPIQKWDSDQALDLARQATLFARDQKQGKKSRLDFVVTGLSSILRMVKDVNIFIVSHERTEMKGTPFDEVINQRYERLKDEARESRRPLITTLVVRSGAYSSATVTLAGEPISLPPRLEPPPPPEPVAPPPAALPENSAAEAKPKRKPASATPRSPIIMSGSSPSPSLDTPTPTPTPAPPAPAPTTPAPLVQYPTPSRNRNSSSMGTILSYTPLHSVETPVSLATIQSEPPASPTSPSPPPPAPTTSRSSQDPMATSPTLTSKVATPVVPTPAATPLTTPHSTPVEPKAPAQEANSAVAATQKPVAPPDPSPAQSTASKVAATLAQLSPQAQPVAARELPPGDATASDQPSPTPRPEVAAMVTPGSPGQAHHREVRWYLGGVALLVVSGSLLVIFWVLHRKACGPSAITQSMHRR